MTVHLKFVSGAVVADSGLSDRQIRVVANSGRSDRVKDVLVAKGARLDSYRANPIVLAQHNPEQPIGNFAPEVKGEALEGVITFAPAGVSAKADEYCGLYKSGVLTAVSVGFKSLNAEPIKGGGTRYLEWELMELSCVSVPCDPNSVTVARALVAKANGEVWKVGASRNLPIGGDESWDGSAAEKSIFDHAGFDGDAPDLAFARKGFLAYDSANPKLKGSYKEPFAKMVDGRLTAMPAGIRAAASRLPQADLPDEVAKKARAVVDHYEAKMKDKGAAAPVVKTGLVTKDLWDVACLAEILQRLGWAHGAAEFEAEIERDDSKVPAMLASALRELAAAFEAMASEEARELLAGHGVELDEGEAVEAGAAAPKLKVWRSLRAKAGRAISQANQDLIDKAISHLDQAADCHVKAADSHDDASEAIAEARAHLDEATKCMKGVGKKPPDDGDEAPNPDDDEADDPEPDVELAAGAERRKRAVEIARLAAI